MHSKNLELLRNDDHYYGEIGAKYLSNSDIKSLLENPSQFKISETSVEMLHGKYFHMKLIEPDREDEFEIVEAKTRNTNVYKDAVLNSGTVDEPLILEKEAEALDVIVKKIKSNMGLHEIIYSNAISFETPMVKKIHGEMWKGKADVVTNDYVIDLKTSANILTFRRSAWDFNYESQAWLYQELFEKPVIFIVACKKTNQIGIRRCSPEFLERGELKVMEAVSQYRKFYGPNKTEDPNNYYTDEILS